MSATEPANNGVCPMNAQRHANAAGRSAAEETRPQATATRGRKQAMPNEHATRMMYSGGRKWRIQKSVVSNGQSAAPKRSGMQFRAAYRAIAAAHMYAMRIGVGNSVRP